jgi:hypothetical protein
MTKDEIRKLFEDNFANMKKEPNEFRYRRFS